MVSVSELRYYPLKSGFPVNLLTGAKITSGGIQGDRRYMLVDAETEKFMSLRDKEIQNFGKISLIDDPEDGDVKVVTMSDIYPRVSSVEKTISINYRDQDMDVFHFGDWMDSFISEKIGHPVKLVKSIDELGFYVDGNPNNEIRNEGLSDGFPLLITSRASLDFLQNHFEGDEEIVMERFRPNIIVEGAEPFEEDSWKTIQIGDVVFDLPKPCQRCVITTVNPETGERHPSTEPLRTLNQLRRGFETVAGKDRPQPRAYFGMNAVPRLGNGEVAYIEPNAFVEVLERYNDVHPNLEKTKIRAGHLTL